MAFSTDENLLNQINIDSIRQYSQFIEQLRPIMLQESGFTEVTTDRTRDEALGLLRESDPAGRGAALMDHIDRLRQIQSGQIKDRNYRNMDQVGADLQASERELERYLQPFMKQKKLEKTPERLALEERYKALEGDLMTLSQAQLERQNKALRGEIPNTQTLLKTIGKEFNSFKEAEARRGNIIMGDDPFSAVAKGTAAQEALRAFQENATVAKEREIQSIVAETPFAYGGFELAAGSSGPRAYSMPGSPNYAGLQGMSLSGSQPFQFNRQMEMQQRMEQSSRNRSGRSGLVGTMLGAGAGALLAAPTGGMSMIGGAQLGGYFGGGAGQLFSGGY